MLAERLGVPAYIDNDVRSAVTAELVLGCGRYSDNFIYLNVGTGLAAGFVIDRHILRGAGHNAGDIGGYSRIGAVQLQPTYAGLLGAASLGMQ